MVPERMAFPGMAPNAPVHPAGQTAGGGEQFSAASFCGWRGRNLEVTYRMTWREWQESYRVGASQMTVLNRAVWSVFLLLFFVVQLLRWWLHNYPITWPLAQLPPLLSPADTAGYVVATGLGLMIGSILVAFFSPLRRVQADPSFLICKIWGLSHRLRWDYFTAILDTGEYICFCRNYPVAVVVPKSALRGKGQADIFLEQATQYWREAKGILPHSLPDIPGIWPPAPRPGNSAQPSDTEEG